MANLSTRAIERLHKARNYKLVPFAHQIGKKAADLVPTRTGHGSKAGKASKPAPKFVHVSKTYHFDPLTKQFVAAPGNTLNLGRNALKRSNHRASVQARVAARSIRAA